MTNILRFDGFGDTEIRVTEDGRYSVYDVIRLCTGNKNPSQFWNGDKGDRKNRQKGLIERFPEVIRKSDNFKFPGRGQRETPVASRENILYIIGLLPGEIGRAYREDAAKVFLQYLDASPELAESVIDRATPEDLRRIERRLAGKKIRVKFTSILQDHGVVEGWQFAACTDAVYRPLFGQTARQLREARSVPVKKTPRDAMTSLELAAVALTEELAAHNIETKDLQGFTPCRDECSRSASKVRRAIDED